MSTVSVPEKTLEHWASIYLTYRYRSHSGLWWPTRGEDIRVRWSPHRPGKMIQLEVKTTTYGAMHQDVLVNLGQLWDYSHRPAGEQPFYVFPIPGWTGELETFAAASGRAPTELAFSRSGPNLWFADWMYVLTTKDVADVLASELKAHGSSVRKGATVRLVRVLPRKSPVGVVWGSGSFTPDPIPWLDFWDEIDGCGREGWPQLIRLPSAELGHQTNYSHGEVRTLLSEIADSLRAGRWEPNTELRTLAPNQDGRFEIAQDNLEPAIRDVSSDEIGLDPSEADNRIFTFIDAQALR